MGPSGVGKNTLVQEILKKYEFFEKKVSYTTRPEKKIIKEGNNYKLITREEFEKVSSQFFHWITHNWNLENKIERLRWVPRDQRALLRHLQNGTLKNQYRW